MGLTLQELTAHDAIIRSEDDLGGAERLLFELGTLRVAASIGRHGGVPAAARSAGKPASALYRTVSGLEHNLGLPLFERRRGKASASVYGQALFVRMDRVEAELTAIRTDLLRNQYCSPAALEHLLSSGRKLLLLIRLAEAGSASGAATHLGITQAGVSQALGRIELALASPLFHRSVRGLVPTDTGERLILRCKLIRAELRHALSELAMLAGTGSGPIVVGALPMARADILPSAIAQASNSSPLLRIRILEAQRDTLLAHLRAGEADIVLSARDAGFDARGLIIEPLAFDRQVIVASPNHLLAAKAKLRLRELAEESWILPWRNAISRALFERLWKKEGMDPPNPVVETGDLLVMRPLLGEGRMLAFVSLDLVQREIDAGALKILDVEMEPVGRDIVLLQRESALLPPSAEVLAKAIRKAARTSKVVGPTS